MTVARTVELEGHIIDSGMMQRCFGVVMDMDGAFEVETFDVGRHKDEESYCRMTVSADSEEDLVGILHELHQNGATLTDPGDARVEPAPADRVVPDAFYSTTNHPTEVRIDGEWIPVDRIEMDCAIVVEPGEGDGDRDASGVGAGNESGDGDGGEDGADIANEGSGTTARTKVLNAVEAGDLVVVGESGIRVKPPERPRDAS
ncbi:TIGR00300 family protein, partial [Halobium palmae]